MDAVVEPELHHVEDPLTLSSGLLDVEMPLESVHDLLRESQLSFPWFDFSSSESRELSPQRQVDTSSSTDNLSDSDQSTRSLTSNHSSISSHPEATGAREEMPCRNPQGSCIDLATRVLNSMHPGSYSCVLSMNGQDGDRQPQPSRGADALLNLNQSALAAVRSMLQCSCCGVPQVILLVTAICSQIGASYRQVVDIYSQRRKSNANSAVLSIRGGKFETQRRDLFIGNHRLSQDVEAAVIRQILLGMLRELEVVIGDIACHAGQSPAVKDPTSDLMLSGMRAGMVAFLHTQIHTLTSALDHLESDVGAGLPPYSHY
ncbi:hypothetical protein MMC29_000459 [Sticta canariensis]|nr:hypothetical protein [Sticta canariensis]